MTTVDDVIAVAQQLSPVEQLEIIQSLTQTLKQKYAQTAAVASPSASNNKRRIAGLHQGKVWMSDDFNDELPDEFWFGDNESAA